MTHEVVPCHRRPLGARPEARSGHVSVAFGPCVYVWGGYHEIQVFNMASDDEWSVVGLYVWGGYHEFQVFHMASDDECSVVGVTCYVANSFFSNCFDRDLVFSKRQAFQVARWTDERYLPSSVLWILNTFTREWKKQNCTGQLPRVSSGKRINFKGI